MEEYADNYKINPQDFRKLRSKRKAFLEVHKQLHDEVDYPETFKINLTVMQKMALIKPGGYLGHQAIEENSTRAMSAVVRSPFGATLCSLTRRDYINAVGKSYKQLKLEEAGRLLNFPIFASFT